MLIIGNGTLGMFLAAELAEREIGSVAVVGPADRSGGGSQAAGAMLGCFGEVTSETLRTAAGRARFEIGIAAHDRWPEVLCRLEEFSPTSHALQTATDTHVVLNAIGSDLDSINYAAIIDALDVYKKPWKEIEPHDIPGYNSGS
ncbi:FAD-dependent oxidoreductase [Actinomadura litoris]|nr:FAD-dependent oxidoreductase [Actinomadura litoris]